MHIFFRRRTNFQQTFDAIFGEKKKKKIKEIRREIRVRYRHDRLETRRGFFERAWSCEDFASLTKTRALEKDLKVEKFWVTRRLGNTHRPVIRNTWSWLLMTRLFSGLSARSITKFASIANATMKYRTVIRHVANVFKLEWKWVSSPSPYSATTFSSFIRGWRSCCASAINNLIALTPLRSFSRFVKNLAPRLQSFSFVGFHEFRDRFDRLIASTIVEQPGDRWRFLELTTTWQNVVEGKRRWDESKSRFHEPYDPGECRAPTRRLLTNGCQFQSTLVLLLTRSKERSLRARPRTETIGVGCDWRIFVFPGNRNGFSDWLWINIPCLCRNMVSLMGIVLDRR